MELRELAQQAVAVGGGASVVGGAAVWLFREKIAGFVDRRVEGKLEPLVSAQSDMEERMKELEHESTVTGQTVKAMAESIEGHMTRQTQALLGITVELTAQGKQMAEMRGEMNAVERRR